MNLPRTFTLRKSQTISLDMLIRHLEAIMKRYLGSTVTQREVHAVSGSL